MYKVSNLGRVRSLDRVIVDKIGRSKLYKGKILTPVKNGSGYLQIGIHKNGERKMLYVHKLVAEHFVCNPRNLNEVNHIDHNKLNCKADNLEWCTREENMKKMSEFYRENTQKTKIVFKYDKENTCIDCGVSIHRTSLRCNTCNNLNRELIAMNKRPSKDKLLYLIKNNSFIKVGKMYNVSDNTIRKWCKNYGIPHRRKDLSAK